MSNWFKRLFQKKRKEQSKTVINNDAIVSSLQFRSMFCFDDVKCIMLNRTLNEYGITRKDDVARFLAQVAHESGIFRYKDENLNYSFDALLRVFGKYFDIGTAKAYARKPELIANRVYANRMGNGDEASGDGWKFRGRGYIQLTGRYNYERYGRFKNMSVDDVISYLETEEGAFDVAGWYFWKNKIINKDIVRQTKVINGGLNGLKHRKELYEKYKHELSY